MIYHPEMGEARPEGFLFYGQICLSYYSVYWSPARDAEARETFARLRIRPRRPELRGPHELTEYGRKNWPHGKYVSHVTYDAADKLRDAGLFAIEQLLD